MTSALPRPSLHYRMRAAHEGGRLCRTVLQGEDMAGFPGSFSDWRAPVSWGADRPAGRERNFRLNSVNFVNLAAKEGLGRVNSPDNSACRAPRAEKFVPPLFH
jgi:hypothetical protein